MKIDPVDIGGYYVLVCVLALLYSILYRTLKQSSMFNSRSVVAILAIAILILCSPRVYAVIGNRAIPSNEEPTLSADTTDHDQLVPLQCYINPSALAGVLILTVWLLISLGWLIHNTKWNNLNNKSDQNALHGKSNQQWDHIWQSADPPTTEPAEDDGQDDDLPGRWVS
jgi:hypothetical protein